jgi:hypothetical protein
MRAAFIAASTIPRQSRAAKKFRLTAFRLTLDQTSDYLKTFPPQS